MGLNFGIEGEEGNFLFITNVLNFFSRALKDAERAILLQKDWPKGYFRKGRALAGLRVRFLLKKIYNVKKKCRRSESCSLLNLVENIYSV